MLCKGLRFLGLENVATINKGGTMKTFTNEECQVIVKALDGLSQAVEIIADRICDGFDGETFTYIVQPFKDSANFAKSARFQLDKIQNRLQS